MQRITVQRQTVLDLLSGALFGYDAVFPPGTDWETVLREGMRLTVAAPVIRAADRERLPAALCRQMDDCAEALLVENLCLQGAHVQLDGLMRRYGIPYCILKGCACAYYYPDPAMRTMGDVDFLIRPEDRERTERMLCENGFVLKSAHQDYHVIYTRGDIVYEMHYEPPGVPQGAAHDAVLARLADTVDTAREVTGSVGTFRMPDDFHHGLILLLHSAHHLLTGGVGLRQLCDWAVFATRFPGEEFAALFEEPLRALGLWEFARVLTGTAVRYLHMPAPDRIGMPDGVLCDALMADILDAGNLGRGQGTRGQEGYLISTYGRTGASRSAPVQLLLNANHACYLMWGYMERYKILLPIGWIRLGWRHLVKVIRGERRWILSPDTVRRAGERKKLYAKLNLFHQNEE